MRSNLYINLPNLISLMRLILSPAMLFISEELLPFFFLLLALSDAIDGFLARRLRALTELGKVLDPLADKVMLTSGLFLCVYRLKAFPEWFFYLSLSRDLFLVTGGLFLTLKRKRVPPARLAGKAYTLFFSFLLTLCLFSFGVENLYLIALLLLLVSWLDYLLIGLKSWR